MDKCLTWLRVATALPTLGAAFNAADNVSWVGTSSLLTSTACQPLYGRMSDIYGRKVSAGILLRSSSCGLISDVELIRSLQTILLGSLLFFLVGSIISGASVNITMLIVART